MVLCITKRKVFKIDSHSILDYLRRKRGREDNILAGDKSQLSKNISEKQKERKNKYNSTLTITNIPLFS